jgi:SAM-dependent methyltransferase
LKPEPLASSDVTVFLCPQGCRFPFTVNIPRFVEARNYASRFGFQWNTFGKTQLDSCTGTTISRDRLKRCLGGSFELVTGKDVLEVGCGAGRFTEVLLAEGARVVAVDLSTAVEANYANCHSSPNYFVCQADVLNLPFKPNSFEIVVCLGVVQHTPNPEETIKALCSHVKPGGLLALDHYTYGYSMPPSRRLLRAGLRRMPPRLSLFTCRMLVSFLWPVHSFLWRYRYRPQVQRLRQAFVRHSPVVDYHEAYGQLGPELLRAWAMLDTHDTLTDRYKHLRSAEEITTCLRQCGMTEIETVYAGNGVEARARKPLKMG